MSAGAGREMPQYQCHKKVRALKIAAIAFHKDKSATVSPKDDGYGPFDIAPEWRERFKGSENDLGYYVVYDDGYKSWSPAKAFEDGYSLIPGYQKGGGK